MESYDSSQIQVLTIKEGVRKRPAMYFGYTDSRVIEHFVYELVSNVLDCYLANTATFVQVEIIDGVITVTDDGPGFPFDLPSDDPNTSLATSFLTVPHLTGTADRHAPHVHVRYTDGVGLCVLNIASSKFQVQSWCNGICWEQNFSTGVALDTPKIIEQIDGFSQGTKIRLTPDPELFPGAIPRLDVICSHLLETAHLVKGIKIKFQQEQFYAPQGLVQLLPQYLQANNIPFDSTPFHYTITSQQVLIDVVAYGITKSTKALTFSWVNGGRSIEDGSHVNGFLNALADVQWQPIVLMIHVVMFEPEYAGPTRTKLCVPKIAAIIQKALAKPLQKHLGSQS